MISTISLLDIRTFVAIALAIGCFLVFIAVANYVSHEMRKPGWYHRFGNQAAVAILFFMFGESLNRGWGPS